MTSIASFISRLRQSQLFNDSFWALLGSALGKGLSFIAGIVVARCLGSTVYGEYGLIRSTLTYIAIVSTFGLGYSATKFIAEYVSNNPNKIINLTHKVMGITLMTSGCLALLQALFATPIAHFVDAPHLNSTIQAFSPLIIFNALSTTQIAILAGLKKFKATAKVNAVAGVATFILSAIGAYFWQLNGALSALLVSFILQVIICNIEINKSTSCYTNGSPVTKNEIVPIIKFSFPIALQDSFYAIAHWLSTYVIIKLSNYYEVGMISAAAIWQSIVIFVPAMLKNVMLSHLSSSTSHKSLVNKFLIINLIASTLPVLVIILSSGLLESFYGDSFEGLRYVIITMCTSAVFICLGEVFVYELLASGHPWLVFVSRLMRDMLTVGIAIVVLMHVDRNYALYYSIVALIIHVIYLGLIYCFYKQNCK